MLGTYDFCGHYDWTFEWLHREGGEPLVRRYWEEAIGGDSQRHAAALIVEKGFAGMKEYWAHTLAEEAAGYTFTEGDGVARIDMHECPSKGFLLRNGIAFSRDYCDHCIGWIGPVMKRAGFVIHHEHNHRGKCGWEFRRKEDPSDGSAPGELAGPKDVRLDPAWNDPEGTIECFERANEVFEKKPPWGRIRN